MRCVALDCVLEVKVHRGGRACESDAVLYIDGTPRRARASPKAFTTCDILHVLYTRRPLVSKSYAMDSYMDAHSAPDHSAGG